MYLKKNRKGNKRTMKTFPSDAVENASYSLMTFSSFYIHLKQPQNQPLSQVQEEGNERKFFLIFFLISSFSR